VTGDWRRSRVSTQHQVRCCAALLLSSLAKPPHPSNPSGFSHQATAPQGSTKRPPSRACCAGEPAGTSSTSTPSSPSCCSTCASQGSEKGWEEGGSAEWGEEGVGQAQHSPSCCSTCAGQGSEKGWEEGGSAEWGEEGVGQAQHSTSCCSTCGHLVGDLMIHVVDRRRVEVERGWKTSRQKTRKADNKEGGRRACAIVVAAM
jgi:hypothetical protein